MILSTNERHTLQEQAKYYAIPDRPAIRSGNSKLQRPPLIWVTLREIRLSEQDRDKQAEEIREASLRLIRSMAGIREFVFYRIRGDESGKVSVSIGLGGPSRSKDDAERIVRSAFPSAELHTEARKEEEPGKYGAYAVGIPRAIDLEKASWINALLRGCEGQDFTVLIAAAPLSAEEVQARRHKLYEERDRVYPYKSGSVSESNAENTQLSDNNNMNSSSSMIEGIFGGKSSGNSTTSSEGRTETQERSRELEQADAVALVRILDYQIERYDRGIAEGMWQTAVYFGAASAKTLEVIKAAYSGGAAGGEDTLSPAISFGDDTSVVGALMRKLHLPEDEHTEDVLNGKLSRATSLLHSSELACIASLPELEWNGYGVTAAPDYGVNPGAGAGSLALGRIVHRGTATRQELSLEPEQLSKHALITGLTGGGKTNTIFRLLEGLKLPFLVIEPVKTEYRHLMSKVPELKVYTLGVEQLSPFRLNPFHFPEGCSLQQHIDSLKAIFMASFSMYASMPNILEQCLQTIYLKRGWSLHHSTNIYVDDSRSRNRYFPTLHDLYHEVDDYLSVSGYAEEQKSNIRAALLTRLKSLMVGSKGLLLNTRECFDFGELLKYPTVLELEGIADEDDKALVMGLLFVRLAEQLKVEKPLGKIDIPLRHVTVVEEAHRVFSNHTPQGNPEVADIKGKSAQYFSNLLSEIRSMGEGMLIVDQIPTKLAPDAVKNTNLKVVHRLVSRDDGEIMCNALGLEPDHAVHLAVLKKGEALVFQEGMNRPVQLHIYPAKEQIRYIEDRQLLEAAQAYNAFMADQRYVHPFAEVMIQDEYACKKIMQIGQRLYNSLLFGGLDESAAAVKEAQGLLLKLAYRLGLDVVPGSAAPFLQTMTEMMMEKVLDASPYFAKITRIRDLVAHYLGLLIQGAESPWSVRERNLLDLRRRETIYPLLIESYERVLSDVQTAACLFEEPSAADGASYLAANELLQAGILQQAARTEDKAANVRRFAAEVGDRLRAHRMTETRTETEATREWLYKTLLLLLQKVDSTDTKRYVKQLVMEG